MSRKRMPPASRIPVNLEGREFLPIEEIHVGSWCPLPDGKGPATQVHVTLTVGSIPYPLVLRFKSAAGLDNFINVLKRHRFDVWPHVPPAADDEP